MAIQITLKRHILVEIYERRYSKQVSVSAALYNYSETPRVKEHSDLVRTNYMDTIGLFVLMLGIGTFVLIYGMRIKARRNERLAQLYQQALEQGIDPRELKFEIDEQEAGDPHGNLKAGIILLATALGILLGIAAAVILSGVWRALGFVLVPAAIGFALLFIHSSIPRDKSKKLD